MARWVVGFLSAAVLVLSGCRDPNLKQVGEDREGDSTRINPDTGGGSGGGGGTVIGMPTCVSGICTPPQAQPLPRTTRVNPIPAENALPGNSDWRAGSPSWDHQVETYASTDSAQAGDTIKVRVSTSISSTVSAEVYRLGYYNGAGARKVWSGGPFNTVKQAPCTLTEATGLIECHWQDTFSFKVDSSWVSGMYVVKVKRADNYFRFAPFVVRDDRAAEVLFGTATNTYQAYNNWGGESLYSDASGKQASGMAHEVSYDRPYDGDDGAGQQLRYEYHLARFLEKNGYDVSYVTNLDFVRFSNLLDGVGVFVHGGHDEYWNPEQRDQLDQAVAAGSVSLVNFGGNEAYWRTRALANTDGEIRTIACYKAEPLKDPIPNSTLRYRDDPINHPESLLYGAMYDGWQVIAFPLVVKDGSHWLFEGTGLTTGTLIPGLVGYEFDRWNPSLFPTPTGVFTPFESPVLTAEGVPSRSHSVERTIGGNHLVFSAGTIYWPLALAMDYPTLYDARVARMTLNVMERALAPRRAPKTLANMTGPFPAQSAPDARWATVVEAYAGSPGLSGAHDGPANQATFDGPTGLAVLPTEEVVVADTVGNRIRLIGTDPQRTVTTIAGDGRLGFKDGPGATAMFRYPIGLLARPDGSVLVADSDNHCIRKLTRGTDGTWTVSLFAGTVRSSGNTNGALLSSRFNRPVALAADALGNVYVAEAAGSRIRKIAADGSAVSTIAGVSAGYADAAMGTLARFNTPSALALSATGDIYVMDAGNQRVRKISGISPYAVTTIAGTDNGVLDGYWQQGGSFGFQDGPGDKARFLAQLGLVMSPYGELLLADAGNGRIRKIILGADRATTNVYTIAGTGRVGTALGTGAQSDLVSPAGLAIMANEKILISDPYNNVIRLMTR